jgi:hypothetical protein
VSVTGVHSAVSNEEALAFATHPARYFRHSWHAMQHAEPDRLHALQLVALKLRVHDLRERIPTVATLTRELGSPPVNELDDVVPMLFQHSVYKSYPPALLERGRFADLTRWLSRLTTHDLSDLPVEGCQGIDDWLDVLDGHTSLRAMHSSGTTGTMSFVPRDLAEWDRQYEAFRCGMFQLSDPHDEHDHTGEYFELVWPLYERGRSAITRLPEMALTHLLGSPERFHALRRGRMSSDAMYLAGRMRAASARGELDRLEISPALRARREEFEREQREMREGLPRFIEQSIHHLSGRRIWMLGTWNVLYEIARVGLDHGLERVFAPDSLVSTGGGAKGQVVPDDWEDTVKRFVGVDRLQHGYSMTEVTALHKMCEHGHYHFEPWVIPFVLDPGDGRPLPRSGRQTGRAAFFDLLPDTYWGGFITGDEVTADWSRCPCGRSTPHIEREIERYSEKHGDDKITCAASDEAHQSALQLLNDRLT